MRLTIFLMLLVCLLTAPVLRAQEAEPVPQTDLETIVIPDSEPMEESPDDASVVVHPPDVLPNESTPPLPDASGAVSPPPPPVDAENVNPPAQEGDDAPSGALNMAVLQGINKVTARSLVVEAPVGATVKFDRLDIMVRACWQSAPGQKPESAALMEVKERKPGETTATPVFFGWMFASSPGISSLEHPLYDITVLKCEGRKEQAAE